MLAEAQQSPADAVASLKVVGDAVMQAVPVRPVQEPNALCHFLDGIQRQRIIYYDGIVPVFYAYLSAAVRSRVHRRMCCLHTEEYISPLRRYDALYAPVDHVDSSGLRQFEIPVQDIGVGVQLPSHPVLLQHASSRIGHDREELERSLAQEWSHWLQHHRPEEWLVVDGTLAEIAPFKPNARVIGLAKTSMGVECMLEREQAEVVYGLRQGERSSVFYVFRKNKLPVYSWFIRLHPPKKGSLLYGLLRVEAPVSEELLRHVDTLSAWLLQDRTPLSVPDTRYDRLLYPMRDCEQYLRSFAPSHAQIEAIAQMVR